MRLAVAIGVTYLAWIAVAGSVLVWAAGEKFDRAAWGAYAAAAAVPLIIGLVMCAYLLLDFLWKWAV